MNIFSDSNTENVKLKAIVELHKALKNNITSPILLLLSGGSWFHLYDQIPEDCFSNFVTISVLDERYSSDPSVNNFAQFAKTVMYQRATVHGCKFIDTRVRNNESMTTLERRFELGLRQWRENNKNGIVIATMGIGPDGHTSGILPFPENPQLFKELFGDENKWIVSYDAQDKNPYRYRITTTISFLVDQIDSAVVYCIGNNKQEALEQIIEGKTPFYDNPGSVLHNMKSVELCTDVDLNK